MQKFISTTEIQRNAKKIFQENGVNTVLKDNKVAGILFTGKGTETLLNSDFLQEYREELYEVNDKKTQKIIDDYRKGKREESIEFHEFDA